MNTPPIVVGIDGSPEAQRALAYAITAAGQDNRGLIAVHVS